VYGILGCMLNPPSSTEDALRTLKARYDNALAALEEARDQEMRNAHAQGYAQKDIINLTGYARETVRRALNPEVKQQAKEARSAREKRTT